jgi:TonB-dependent SusC/RagA subfamily outer membrane receptor
MKAAARFASGFVLATLTLGCVSSGPAGEESAPRPERPDGAIVDEAQSMLSLADYLRRVPGVLVTGSGVNTRVEIRGVSSFLLNTEPLYVIDGQEVGTRYADAARMVPVQQIDYVRVLKGSDAAIYGVRGANGVILIVTKK